MRHLDIVVVVKKLWRPQRRLVTVLLLKLLPPLLLGNRVSLGKVDGLKGQSEKGVRLN